MGRRTQLCILSPQRTYQILTMGRRFLLVLACCLTFQCEAQFKHRIKKNIKALCAPGMYGRGYVNGGVNTAAQFLYKKMERSKLRTLPLANETDPYFQSYQFPVNTISDSIHLNILYYYNQKKVNAGTDFLIDAASPGINAHQVHLEFINVADSVQRNSLLNPNHPGFAPNTALVLRFMPRGQKDILEAIQKMIRPPRLLVYTVKNKLTHTVSTNVENIPAIWIFDSLLNNAQAIDIQFEHQFNPNYPCRNVCGYVPGKNQDSFMVFTAHYDHLGMMGPNARFAGASDNASGTAFVLELMRHYSKHKPKYNTAFIFFSGEEAGLLGSKHFVANPLLPLNRIKQLINIDIMGNAEKGITVVNATVLPERFSLLQQVAVKTDIKPRGPSYNSDHAPFSNKNIPAFFIYSNGGPGYYHDVFDLPKTCKLKGVKNTFRSIQRFTNSL